MAALEQQAPVLAELLEEGQQARRTQHMPHQVCSLIVFVCWGMFVLTCKFANPLCWRLVA